MIVVLSIAAAMVLMLVAAVFFLAWLKARAAMILDEEHARHD